MTGFSNVIAGTLHELAKDKNLENGLGELFSDILAALQKHAAKTASPVDDVLVHAAKTAAPFVIAKYVGVRNGANGDT